MSEPTRYLSFQQVKERLNNGQPVYVKNLSKDRFDKIFMIVIDYPSAEGMLDWRVPRSPTPFDITDHLSAEELKNSRAFRNYISNGLIGIVDDDEYERQATTAAKIAWQAANQEANNTHTHRRSELIAARRVNADAVAAASQPAIAGIAGVGGALTSIPGLSANVQSALGLPSPVKVNQRLVTITERVTRDDAYRADGNAVLRDLQLMHGDLSLADVEAVAANTLFPLNVRQWAKEILPSM